MIAKQDTDAASSGKEIRALKILRLLKLGKLLRVARLVRMAERYRESLRVFMRAFGGFVRKHAQATPAPFWNDF